MLSSTAAWVGLASGSGCRPQRARLPATGTKCLVTMSKSRVLRVGFVPHRHHPLPSRAVQHEDRHPRGQQARLGSLATCGPRCGGVDGEEGVRGA